MRNQGVQEPPETGKSFSPSPHRVRRRRVRAELGPGRLPGLWPPELYTDKLVLSDHVKLVTVCSSGKSCPWEKGWALCCGGGH